MPNSPKDDEEQAGEGRDKLGTDACCMVCILDFCVQFRDGSGDGASAEYR